MATANLRRTSPDTADLDPQPIRDGKTSRLVFKGQLVNNKRDADRPVQGDLIWQKRGSAKKDEPWEDEGHFSLNRMTAGTGVKLHLKCSEVHRLTQIVRGLYGWFFKNGKQLPSGLAVVDLATSARAAKNLDLSENLDALLALVPDEDVGKLFRRLAAGPDSAEVVRSLSTLPAADLADVGALAGIGLLRRLLDIWRTNESNDSEPFWQRTLQDHAFVLSQLFAAPVVTVSGQAYAGGKSVHNAGGKLPDFLVKNVLGGHVALIEIKTPATTLLRATTYRGGVYAPTEDLAGSVVQVLAQREKLQQSFCALRSETEDQTEERLRAASPQCFVIIGHRGQLDTVAKSDSFEWYRRGLLDVQVITFDELFRRLEDLLDLLRTCDGTSGAPAAQGDGSDNRQAPVAAGGGDTAPPAKTSGNAVSRLPEEPARHRRRAR